MPIILVVLMQEMFCKRLSFLALTVYKVEYLQDSGGRSSPIFSSTVCRVWRVQRYVKWFSVLFESIERQIIVII